MSSKTVSVWLNADEQARYQRAADAKGVSVSTYFKQCADAALTPPDPRADFRRLAADLRADLNQSIDNVTEAARLAADARQESADEIRQLFAGFLHDLEGRMSKVVVGAFQAGQTRPAKPATEPVGLKPAPPLSKGSP